MNFNKATEVADRLLTQLSVWLQLRKLVRIYNNSRLAGCSASFYRKDLHNGCYNIFSIKRSGQIICLYDESWKHQPCIYYILSHISDHVKYLLNFSKSGVILIVKQHCLWYNVIKAMSNKDVMRSLFGIADQILKIIIKADESLKGTEGSYYEISGKFFMGNSVGCISDRRSI